MRQLSGNVRYHLPQTAPGTATWVHSVFVSRSAVLQVTSHTTHTWPESGTSRWHVSVAVQRRLGETGAFPPQSQSSVQVHGEPLSKRHDACNTSLPYLTAERSEPCHAACSNSALARVTLRVHAPQSQDCVHGFANETPHIAIFLALIAQFTPQETPATYPTNIGATWGWWLMPRPGRFTPGNYPDTRGIGGRVGPRTGRDNLASTEIVHPVASRYTDWAIPAHGNLSLKTSDRGLLSALQNSLLRC
jgi:hypothetical protein